MVTEYVADYAGEPALPPCLVAWSRTFSACGG
jgi:hypothetical protein